MATASSCRARRSSKNSVPKWVAEKPHLRAKALKAPPAAAELPLKVDMSAPTSPARNPTSTAMAVSVANEAGAREAADITADVVDAPAAAAVAAVIVGHGAVDDSREFWFVGRVAI